MKCISLIFSFLIFFQSLTVCAPPIYKQTMAAEKSLCQTVSLSNKENKKHSCCNKTSQSDDSEDKDACCGDDCSCICCTKVFFQNNFSKSTFPIQDILFVETNILPLFCHSFDFHLLLVTPPRI